MSVFVHSGGFRSQEPRNDGRRDLGALIDGLTHLVDPAERVVDLQTLLHSVHGTFDARKFHSMMLRLSFRQHGVYVWRRNCRWRMVSSHT